MTGTPHTSVNHVGQGKTLWGHGAQNNGAWEGKWYMKWKSYQNYYDAITDAHDLQNSSEYNRTMDEFCISMLALWPLIAIDASTEDEQIRGFDCEEDRRTWPAKVSVLTFQEAY